MGAVSFRRLPATARRAVTLLRLRRPELHTLAGAYALDALSEADRARFERHLARCQACAREQRELRELTARLATAVAADPPADLVARVMAAAAAAKQLPLDTGPARAWRPACRMPRTDRLPVWRMGLTGGLAGILCCVGPTVLALLGIVSAGTAFAWATTLYDNYAWWFRLGALAVLAMLVWWSLRRRNQCSLAGVRRWRWRLLGVLAIAVGAYGALYALTTWLGTFA